MRMWRRFWKLDFPGGLKRGQGSSLRAGVTHGDAASMRLMEGVRELDRRTRHEQVSPMRGLASAGQVSASQPSGFAGRAPRLVGGAWTWASNGRGLVYVLDCFFRGCIATALGDTTWQTFFFRARTIRLVLYQNHVSASCVSSVSIRAAIAEYSSLSACVAGQAGVEVRMLQMVKRGCEVPVSSHGYRLGRVAGQGDPSGW
ncbi:hypothetical protein M011DRAFT_31586 [Sporormia fimetaria CBS 119925]|uniref:Uncharacterized protein n=1 Tax=Sporormia fimetaria CBS 119925 TaxID=1340428 RepID=A0A6A6VBY3_9PLEO|nr:hypothetical protein M011DRAFT_31586 [Sporormia fimetaria CBS 119925]